MTTFLLKGAKCIHSEALPTKGCYYDLTQQLWIDSGTGDPVVVSKAANTMSRFGETQFTETRESVDQSESSLISASRFGETRFTSTSEATDQSELTSIIPNLRTSTSLINYEGRANKMDFRSVLQFLIDAPYTHF